MTYSELLGQKSASSIVIKNDSTPQIEFSYDMPYNEAAEYFEKIHSIDARQFYANLPKYAAKAFTISWVNSIETLEDIRKEFAAQTKEHFDPETLKKVIQQTIMSRGEDPLKPSHLANVVRTNVQTAFSKGRMAAQIELDYPFWQYMAVIDGRETPLCFELDGKIFKSNDPFWSEYYPPNHYQCRSSVVARDELDPDETVEESGIEYLKKSDLKNISPGRGFNYSPVNALDKHIQEKAKEHQILVQEKSTPVFKTHQEAEKYLENLYKGSIFDFKGMDIKIINEWATKFIEIVDKYDLINIQYLGTNGKAKFPSQTYSKTNIPKSAVACAYQESGRKFMLVKRKYFSDYNQCLDMVKYNQNANWHSGDTPITSRTLVHELGHWLDYEYKLRNDNIILDLFKSNRHDVSRYGASSSAEFIAEALVDAMTSKTPKDASKKVLARLNEISGKE